MAKTKINLEQIDGLIDPANPPVDPADNAGKIIVCDEDGKLPEQLLDGIDGSKLTNLSWTFISTATGSSSSAIGVPSSASVAIPTGTKFIVIQGSTQQDEGSSNRYYTGGQLILVPNIITSAYYRDLYTTSNEGYIHFTATITGTNVVLTSNIAGGGGATASFSGVCYFFK